MEKIYIFTFLAEQTETSFLKVVIKGIGTRSIKTVMGLQ